MTSTKLTDLMRQQAEELDPASSQRILNDALRGGARRRLRRHLVVGATAATVLAAIATGTGLAMSGGPSRTDNERPDVSATSPSAATAYDPGSETEVPDGPVIKTDRKIVGDAVLLAVTRGLLPANGVVTDLDVAHIESSAPTHTADNTRNGRRASFKLDGAGASVTIQRWDGYAAVGVDLDYLKQIAGPDGELERFDGSPPQKVATTAREACAGSYQVSPAIECHESAEGWYSVGRPSQGAATPNTYQELSVQLYTDDGYVLRVNAYNSSGEKAGPLVAESPVLTVDESLTMARSPLWFVAK